MANINKFYLETISSKKKGYRATWEPNKPLKLGDVGIIENGVFVVMTTLEDEEINMKVREDESEAEWKFTTENAVSIKTKLSGQAPILGSVLKETEAGISIAFKSENAFVFEAIGAKTHLLTNVFEIEKAILAKSKVESRWKNFAVIVELIEAESITIIMSAGSENVVDLKAKTEVALANINLANADLGLSIVSEKVSTESMVAKGGVTPLYRAMGLRHPLFGKAHLETKAVEELAQKESFRILEFEKEEIQ